MIDFEPTDLAQYADPYALLAEVRRSAPVARPQTFDFLGFEQMCVNPRKSDLTKQTDLDPSQFLSPQPPASEVEVEFNRGRR